MPLNSPPAPAPLSAPAHDDIYCNELAGWYTDEEMWPKDRSLKIFKQCFDVEHSDLVEDVGRGPIENDE
jgi:hypothetical protein